MCIVLILINDTFCLITLSPKTIELYFVILSFAHGLPLGCPLFSSEPHRDLIGTSSEPPSNFPPSSLGFPWQIVGLDILHGAPNRIPHIGIECLELGEELLDLCTTAHFL